MLLDILKLYLQLALRLVEEPEARRVHERAPNLLPRDRGDELVEQLGALGEQLDALGEQLDALGSHALLHGAVRALHVVRDMHRVELLLRRRDIRPHGHRIHRARALMRVVVVGHGVLVLGVDAGVQVELGALDGTRLELLSARRVEQAVREEELAPLRSKYFGL